MMRWRAKDLINFANLVGIGTDHVRDDMTPQQRLDLQDDDDRKQDGDDGILFGVD